MTFRHWLQEMWMQHKDELELFSQRRDYEVKDYFNRYKYWLRREYRHQYGKEKIKT
jgi:hypothetical protein